MRTGVVANRPSFKVDLVKKIVYYIGYCYNICDGYNSTLNFTNYIISMEITLKCTYVQVKLCLYHITTTGASQQVPRIKRITVKP